TDPQRFAQNLGQLVTNNFQVRDLRELLNASPFTGRLIQEIFNVDNPTNAQAIRAAAKKLGIRTVGDLANALSEAAENNEVLRGVTDTLETMFDRLRDRLRVALAPVGSEIAKTLLPLFDDLVKAAQKYGPIAAQVFRENKDDILAAAREM